MAGFLSGLGNFISQKPEQFAIMADSLGKGFDPGNAFAGIGTSMGQSSLANKALEDEKTEQQSWKRMIANILAGKQPMTAAGTPGVSGFNVKPSKEGGANEITMSITEPGDVATSGEDGMINPVNTQNNMQKQNLGDLISSPF